MQPRQLSTLSTSMQATDELGDTHPHARQRPCLGTVAACRANQALVGELT